MTLSLLVMHILAREKCRLQKKLRHGPFRRFATCSRLCSRSLRLPRRRSAASLPTWSVNCGATNLRAVTIGGEDGGVHPHESAPRLHGIDCRCISHSPTRTGGPDWHPHGENRSFHTADSRERSTTTIEFDGRSIGDVRGLGAASETDTPPRSACSPPGLRGRRDGELIDAYGLPDPREEEEKENVCAYSSTPRSRRGSTSGAHSPIQTFKERAYERWAPV